MYRSSTPTFLPRRAINLTLLLLCLIASSRYHHHHVANAFSASSSNTNTKTKPKPPSFSKTIVDLKKQQETLDRQLEKCKTGTAARQVLAETLLSPSNNDNDNDNNNNSNTNSNSLYNSLSIPRGASILSISDAELAIQTNIRNNKYSIMELIELNGDKDADRASLALFAIFVGSTTSAIATQNNLPGPEIIRFVISWILSFLPLIFVGLGLSVPAKLQSTLIVIQSYIFPSYRKRMVHHEAGHFLLGHLLGMPIKGYRANAIKNAVEFYPLRDDDVGRSRASLLGFDRKINNDDNYVNYDEYLSGTGAGTGGFFEEGGRGEEVTATQSVFRNAKNYTDNPFLKISPQNDVKRAWPYRGFDHMTIDQLAVVSVAGVCSEILSFGNAEGGFADLGQLRQILSSAEPELDEKQMENVIRYAIGYTMGQLRRHMGALDDLIEVMERDGGVAECILAIEGCENVSGATVMGNYEKIRRDKIQSEGIGLLERLVLGGKNADTEDNSVIYGKGGGDRKQSFQLTGDDPLYAALAIAGVFLVWASSGGLSLH